MKKFLFFALALMPKAYSQCDVPYAVPYQMDIESVTSPALPECVSSYFNSFSSQEEFTTIAGPIEGFTGNVLAYNTIVNSEFIPPESPVSAYLYSPSLQLEQGVNYIVSYKYGNSNEQFTIANLNVSVMGFPGGQVNIAEHANITGGVATTYTSEFFTVPVSGSYELAFSVDSAGSQGLLYLDDIEVREAPAMGVDEAVLSLNSVYPNPVQNLLHLNNGAEVDKLAVYNVAGQQVKTSYHLAPYATIGMDDLSAGIYFVSLSSGSSQKAVKVIKE